MCLSFGERVVFFTRPHSPIGCFFFFLFLLMLVTHAPSLAHISWYPHHDSFVFFSSQWKPSSLVDKVRKKACGVVFCCMYLDIHMYSFSFCFFSFFFDIDRLLLLRGCWGYWWWRCWWCCLRPLVCYLLFFIFVHVIVKDEWLNDWLNKWCARFKQADWLVGWLWPFWPSAFLLPYLAVFVVFLSLLNYIVAQHQNYYYLTFSLSHTHTHATHSSLRLKNFALALIFTLLTIYVSFLSFKQFILSPRMALAPHSWTP